MAIIVPDKDVEIEYIPLCGGNRNSENPCKVKIKFLSDAKAKTYVTLHLVRTKDKDDLEERRGISDAVDRKQFTDHVVSVSGYFVGDREVMDPGEVYDSAESDLLKEIFDAMASSSMLREGQVKNS